MADERRQAKVTGGRGRWDRLNREFTKSAREDKNAYIESKCREMEKDKTNSKEAFRILKEVTGNRSVKTDVINDTEGRALTDILKIWEEYCGKLYKNQDGDNDNNRLDQRCDYDREPPPFFFSSLSRFGLIPRSRGGRWGLIKATVCSKILQMFVR